MAKILAFSGSGRKHSYNYSIVKCAAQGARDAGADVTLVDMSEYDMPIFNEDLESEKGMPEKAQAFKTLLMEHDGFLIASPEYNSGYSALLKNAIDWASRKQEGETPLEAFKNKPAVIMAASPGGLGGIRGLVPLRMLLGNIGVIVLPSQLAVSGVAELVDEQGNVIDDKTAKSLQGLGRLLTEFLKR